VAKDKLTAKQQQILSFLQEFIQEYGIPPTVREIQRSLGLSSTSVVDYNLKQLEEKGYITRNKNISRGISLPFKKVEENVTTIPVVGVIAAGSPIEVPEDLSDPAVWADTIEVNNSLLNLKSDGLFALRVKGHSMVDALIDDGDLIIMRHANTAENGETVAVWLEKEKATTLKKFYHEGDRIRLQPANITMQPIYVSPDDIQIQGKLVAVIRQISK